MHFEGGWFVFFSILSKYFCNSFYVSFSLVCLAWRQSAYGWETNIVCCNLHLPNNIYDMEERRFWNAHTFQMSII